MAIKLRLRIDLTPASAVGPGKIELLEYIAKTGSISAAGRAMDMSYRRAWLLVDELNRLFKEPVATTAHGGRTGGGARLTGFGRDLVQRFRAMEAKAHTALSKDLKAIAAVSLTPARGPRRRRTAPDDRG